MAGDDTASKHTADFPLKPIGTQGKIPIGCFPDFINFTGFQLVPEQFLVCCCSFSSINAKVMINRMVGDERGWMSLSIRLVTRPLVSSGMIHHPGTNRVHLDIALTGAI